MGYELRQHTADVAVEATDETLGGAFGAAADGMAAAMCADWPADGDRDRFAIDVTAESREALLFDYLDELIYRRDVRLVLPVDNRAQIECLTPGEWHLDGSARGVGLDRVEARDLKAVTYSEMVIEETEPGWRVYVVFDV
jgi:SHS2 domain-containing protein